MSRFTVELHYDSYGQRTVKTFGPVNLYETAVIGKDVKIGAFSEVGNNVEIGDNVTIGAHCFICEGVSIEAGAWIGPRVTFTNDRFPPSPKENWEKTVIRKGARIGAGVTILCGIEIGEGALIGAGSTVTKSVPAGETWCGNPAENLRAKQGAEVPRRRTKPRE